MHASASEGVTRFAVTHAHEPLDGRVLEEAARALGAWREVLARLGVIGRDPARYAGLGYGNVSVRVGPGGDAPRGRRPFLVSATQTGGLAHLDLEHFCVVERWDLDANRVESRGLRRPSSESLTHGALYDIAPAARAVLHAHAPEIWRNARTLRLPITSESAANGRPAMAREVQRLVREGAAPIPGVIVMGGHPDGVLGVGESPERAGLALVQALARACAIERM